MANTKPAAWRRALADMLGRRSDRTSDDEALRAAVPSPVDEAESDTALIAFLRDRLLDDERQARYARQEYFDHAILPEGQSAVGFLALSEAMHIVRHDPARVLEEIEAKRSILAIWERMDDAAAEKPSESIYTGACLALRGVARQLAAPFSDHPDYRQEWRP